ncbi:MAG: hypothetical protein ACOYLV_02355 [Rubrivivax sp.]|jgi:hypothetical protein
MSPDLVAASRVRRPLLKRLLAVLRQRATWRTVWRFVWLGPWMGLLLAFLIAWLSMPPQAAQPAGIWKRLFSTDLIAAVYGAGGPPALVAGLLFAAWYHGAGRPPAWPRRAALGALAGLGAAAAGALVSLLAAAGELMQGRTGIATAYLWAYPAAIALFGVPAGVVVALLQRAAPVTQVPATLSP